MDWIDTKEYTHKQIFDMNETGEQEISVTQPRREVKEVLQE